MATTVENININVTTNAGTAASDIDSLAAALRRVSASARTAALPTTAAGIRDVGNAARRANGPLANFANSLRRIAFYRLIRTIIREITQAFAEGLENAYQYSKLVGGDLSRAMDGLASATAQLRNQLGAALGQLLTALAPVLIQIIQLITKLAQGITWLIAVLSGAKEYLVANEIAVEWREATSAAKEYKRTILGFDVINRLNGPNGGGKSTPDYGSMFHYEPTGVGDFTMPDLRTWWVPFINGGQDALNLVHQLIEELNSLPIPDLTRWWDLGAEASKSASEVMGRAFDAIREGLKNLPDRAREAATGLGVVFSGMVATVTATVSQLALNVSARFDFIRNTVRTKMAEARVAAVKEWDTIKQSAVNTTVSIAQTVSERYAYIKTSILANLANARNNILTFTRTTLTSWAMWASNAASSARLAFTNIATNVYLGLKNAGENIVNFINATASGVWEWATNTAKNFASWAQSVADSIGQALKSAWENFKDFMSATGQAISGWWQQNKTWVVPVTIGAAITVGAIALAPMTGGASLAGLAFAANGGSFPNEGSLFVAGEAGPEIVANMGARTGVMNVDQMRDAVREGAYDAIVSALSTKDNNTSVHVYLDSREIKYGQTRLSRAMGV